MGLKRSGRPLRHPWNRRRKAGRILLGTRLCFHLDFMHTASGVVRNQGWCFKTAVAIILVDTILIAWNKAHSNRPSIISI